MEEKIFYNQEELAERWGMSPRTLEIGEQKEMAQPT